MKKSQTTKLFIMAFMLLINGLSAIVQAQITLEIELQVSDNVMYFDGVNNTSSTNQDVTAPYDYAYGNALTPHGDCIKAYKEFVFMTWYRGGKEDRHVMLSRYNTLTGVMKTIEFPHQHTGYNGKWWIGETHNTIAVGICPKDNTIHLVYDLHRNGNITIDNIGTEDYLRYSYSEVGAAVVADDDFTIDRFINSAAGNYKHLAFNGIDDVTVTKLLTYPAFFTNDEGDLFMKNRFGYSENGRFLFARYDGSQWHGYTDFNRSNAVNYGSEYNWGLYGDFKYLNGKIRIGFQRRSNNGTDRYEYQNGIYYAYSDDPAGLNQWKDALGQEFARPLADADLIKIAEPGDWVQTTQRDMVYIVSGFDFTVTDAGDEHFVSMVKDKEYNVTKKLHTYRKAGDVDFTTIEYNAGSELYTSGNDVYVIGLKNGRVNIVKTAGGTSNFVEVYQHTTGPVFDKGVVYIHEGKLYYYLKQAGGTGSSRTTYLQIFDLDLPEQEPQDPTRVLEFNNLTNFQIVDRGTDLNVEANVGSAFTEVALWHGTTNLGTLSTAPYVWSGHPVLTNMTDQSYEFKLIAKDADNVEVETSITIRTPYQWPHTDNEEPHTVPGLIEMEAYDEGGEGIAWYDRSQQGTGKLYRGTDLVDLNSDGSILVYIQGQEWVEYTVNVLTEGYYDISVRQTTRREPSVSNAFSLTFPDEGKTVLSGVNLEYTGSGVYRVQDLGNVFLEAGKHVLRFAFSNYGFDLDYAEFALTSSTDIPESLADSQAVKVYPNPTGSGFTIDLKQIKRGTLSIYNLSGKLVYQQQLDGQPFNLSKGDVFQSGLYLIKVTDEKRETYHQKLLIK